MSFDFNQLNISVNFLKDNKVERVVAVLPDFLEYKISKTIEKPSKFNWQVGKNFADVKSIKTSDICTIASKEHIKLTTVEAISVKTSTLNKKNVDIANGLLPKTCSKNSTRSSLKLKLRTGLRSQSSTSTQTPTDLRTTIIASQPELKSNENSDNKHQDTSKRSRSEDEEDKIVETLSKKVKITNKAQNEFSQEELDVDDTEKNSNLYFQVGTNELGRKLSINYQKEIGCLPNDNKFKSPYVIKRPPTRKFNPPNFENIKEDKTDILSIYADTELETYLDNTTTRQGTIFTYPKPPDPIIEAKNLGVSPSKKNLAVINWLYNNNISQISMDNYNKPNEMLFRDNLRKVPIEGLILNFENALRNNTISERTIEMFIKEIGLKGRNEDLFDLVEIFLKFENQLIQWGILFFRHLIKNLLTRKMHLIEIVNGIVDLKNFSNSKLINILLQIIVQMPLFERNWTSIRTLFVVDPNIVNVTVVEMIVLKALSLPKLNLVILESISKELVLKFKNISVLKGCINNFADILKNTSLHELADLLKNKCNVVPDVNLNCEIIGGDEHSYEIIHSPKKIQENCNDEMNSGGTSNYTTENDKNLFKTPLIGKLSKESVGDTNKFIKDKFVICSNVEINSTKQIARKGFNINNKLHFENLCSISRNSLSKLHEDKHKKNIVNGLGSNQNNYTQCLSNIPSIGNNDINSVNKVSNNNFLRQQSKKSIGSKVIVEADIIKKYLQNSMLQNYLDLYRNITINEEVQFILYSLEVISKNMKDPYKLMVDMLAIVDKVLQRPLFKTLLEQLGFHVIILLHEKGKLGPAASLVEKFLGDIKSFVKVKIIDTKYCRTLETEWRKYFYISWILIDAHKYTLASKILIESETLLFCTCNGDTVSPIFKNEREVLVRKMFKDGLVFDIISVTKLLEYLVVNCICKKHFDISHNLSEILKTLLLQRNYENFVDLANKCIEWIEFLTVDCLRGIILMCFEGILLTISLKAFQILIWYQIYPKYKGDEDEVFLYQGLYQEEIFTSLYEFFTKMNNENFAPKAITFKESNFSASKINIMFVRLSQYSQNSDYQTNFRIKLVAIFQNCFLLVSNFNYLRESSHQLTLSPEEVRNCMENVKSGNLKLQTSYF